MIKVGSEVDGISGARTNLIRRACMLLSALAATLAVTLAGLGTETGLSPRPAEAAPAVKVSVRCDSNPEAVRVTNNSRRAITVRTVGSVYQPRPEEPYRVNRTIKRGKSAVFESAPRADGVNELTGNCIFNSDVGRKEGARVATSVGRFLDRC